MFDPGALRAAALGHGARGWHVFPLRPDDRPHDPDHSKRPAFPDHGEDRCPRIDPRCRDGHAGWETRATCDPTRIGRAWQRTPYNIGIACGPSGLVVIDLDVRKPDAEPPPGHEHYRHGLEVFTDLCRRHGQPVPDDTYTVATGRGGRHLLFEHPPGPPLRNTQGDRGGLGWLIDTRAHGGYIVAPGSTAGGRPYRVLHDRPRPVLPEWLADLLRPAEPVSPRKVLGDFSAFKRGAYVRGAVRRTLDHLAAARTGERNKALLGGAVSLGQFVAGGALTEAEVFEALTPTAQAIGLTERETARTIRSGLRYGATNPRRVA
ncbi:bifunctional DNA primase/polymerase [Actinoplanes sp. NEAU-A12]|uniref:Bifunctional DNA primase/polymerase n=1 Tax=Actinoplanes sandaracinus TaxID=3045177 RepID=A0ABT6WQB9_9ACTN|nr:bifunctional DNA primase/polymerase [Actinoplanes sandaracinus]MDI6101879.1 bifunctional DNA primase/polymerase [Actinoplanes sandaracinus]